MAGQRRFLRSDYCAVLDSGYIHDLGILAKQGLHFAGVVGVDGIETIMLLSSSSSWALSPGCCVSLKQRLGIFCHHDL